VRWAAVDPQRIRQRGRGAANRSPSTGRNPANRLSVQGALIGQQRQASIGPSGGRRSLAESAAGGHRQHKVQKYNALRQRHTGGSCHVPVPAGLAVTTSFPTPAAACPADWQAADPKPVSPAFSDNVDLREPQSAKGQRRARYRAAQGGSRAWPPPFGGRSVEIERRRSEWLCVSRGARSALVSRWWGNEGVTGAGAGNTRVLPRRGLIGAAEDLAATPNGPRGGCSRRV